MKRILMNKKKMSPSVNATLETQKEELKQAYEEAARDQARNELFQEWTATDTEDWEW
jgi:hypothetical protein